MTLTDLIPTQYRLAGWLVIAGAVALAGAYTGHKATAVYYQGKLEAAEVYYQTKLDKAEAIKREFESAYTALAQSSQRQNEAINSLHEEAVKRERRAKVALAKAKAQAQARRNKASNILNLKLPTSADACQAARESFDDELKAERGKR